MAKKRCQVIIINADKGKPEKLERIKTEMNERQKKREFILFVIGLLTIYQFEIEVSRWKETVGYILNAKGRANSATFVSR